MTAKSHNDQQPNDPGTQAPPGTLMSFLQRKFPGLFYTTNDLVNDAVKVVVQEDEHARLLLDQLKTDLIGKFVISPSGFGKVNLVELRFGDKNGFYSTEENKVGHHVVEILEYIVQGQKITATGGVFTVPVGKISGSAKSERGLMVKLREMGIMKKPESDGQILERISKHHEKERVKAIRRIAEGILVQRVARRHPTDGVDRVDVQQAWQQAKLVYEQLNTVERGTAYPPQVFDPKDPLNQPPRARPNEFVPLNRVPEDKPS